MSFITKLLGLDKKAATQPPDSDFWYAPISGRTQSGANVSPDSSLGVSAVLACVVLLSDTVASLPLHMYSRRNDGGKEIIPNHPLYDLLHSQSNKWQTAFELRQMLQTHVLLRGNAYAEIIPGPRGAVDQLVPLHPDRMRVEQLDSGNIVYRYTIPGKPERLYSADDIFHLRGPICDKDGLCGVSLIDLQREAIGGAMAVQDYGNRFLGNNAQPSVVLTHPGQLGAEGAKNLKAGWRQAQGSGQQHGVAVLEEGMDIRTLSVTPEQAQFLETRKFTVTDICRIFRVPPHMIADLEKATFSNIEHQSLDFTVHSLRPWLVRWEQSIARDLIVNNRAFFAEHNVDGLLRGDLKTRYEAYAIARQWGWLSVNEIRRLENKNPVPGGDEFLSPLNMTPAGTDQTEQAKLPESINERKIWTPPTTEA